MLTTTPRAILEQAVINIVELRKRQRTSTSPTPPKTFKNFAVSEDLRTTKYFNAEDYENDEETDSTENHEIGKELSWFRKLRNVKQNVNDSEN
ncbi:hypothetical protein PoB_002294900 [Plakobranchus ocellatus]|uniref:Uncharacterized protein n=1 Tax=Plakobranchus ocellatus TaxID=259542 RepID=A0AAV3ZRF8_9GAST|nr:hypothetical protein PoB_002294900 [Plakobranchus ocellatus]